MRLNEWIKELHGVAVEHGWWEDERPYTEILALIHSELSEALEEARAGHMDVWFGEGGKPEGICVELLDAVIRILDYMGQRGWEFAPDYDVKEYKATPWVLPDALLINSLHDNVSAISSRMQVADSSNIQGDDKDFVIYQFSTMISKIFKRVLKNGYDIENLIICKNEYNKHRPIKHGKQF